MTDLHFAVSFGFGFIGLAAVYCGKRMWNAEKDMRNKRRQIQSRVDVENNKRAEAIGALEARLEEELKKSPLPSDGLTALVATQKALETVFYGWLTQHHHLFYVVWEEKVHIVGVSNGSFKYELPESVQKFKRGKK